MHINIIQTREIEESPWEGQFRIDKGSLKTE